MLQTIICAVAISAMLQPATVSPDMEDEVIHILFEIPEGQDNRGPGIIPISGYVNNLAGLAVLTFSAPCGNVQVQLDNLDDGYHLSASVAGTGSAMIPFACTSGHWLITITLTGGEEYEGTFTL